MGKAKCWILNLILNDAEFGWETAFFPWDRDGLVTAGNCLCRASLGFFCTQSVLKLSGPCVVSQKFAVSVGYKPPPYSGLLLKNFTQAVLHWYRTHIYLRVCIYTYIYIHRSLFMLQILFKAYTQKLMYTLIHAEGLVFCFSLFLCIWVMHRSSETARRNTVQQRWVLQHYNINVRPPSVFKSPIPTLVAVWC